MNLDRQVENSKVSVSNPTTRNFKYDDENLFILFFLQ